MTALKLIRSLLVFSLLAVTASAGERLPMNILREIDANARKAGCARSCLTCLLNIKCTAKMMEFIPEKCQNMQRQIEVVVETPDIPGIQELAAMEQFFAQVHKCGDCTNGCIRGVANFDIKNLVE